MHSAYKYIPPGSVSSVLSGFCEFLDNVRRGLGAVRGAPLHHAAAAHTGAHTSLGGCSAEHVNHLHELNTTSIALLWNPSVCFVKRFTVACVGRALSGELSSYV